MGKEALATEVITEMQERLNNVISEIDSLDADCDKVLFILTEVMISVDRKPPKTEKDIYDLCEKMERIDSLTAIAYDYISKIQSCITDVVLRERNRPVSG